MSTFPALVSVMLALPHRSTSCSRAVTTMTLTVGLHGHGARPFLKRPARVAAKDAHHDRAGRTAGFEHQYDASAHMRAV